MQLMYFAHALRSESFNLEQICLNKLFKVDVGSLFSMWERSEFVIGRSPVQSRIYMGGESEGNCLPHPHSTYEDPWAGLLTPIAPVELLTVAVLGSFQVCMCNCVTDQGVPEKEFY